jgi:hypothetical protein
VLGPISVAKRIDEAGKEFELRRDCRTKGETAVIAEIQNPRQVIDDRGSFGAGKGARTLDLNLGKIEL